MVVGESIWVRFFVDLVIDSRVFFSFYGIEVYYIGIQVEIERMFWYFLIIEILEVIFFNIYRKFKIKKQGVGEMV